MQIQGLSSRFLWIMEKRGSQRIDPRIICIRLSGIDDEVNSELRKGTRIFAVRVNAGADTDVSGPTALVYLDLFGNADER
jgi:hypothetical protein